MPSLRPGDVVVLDYLRMHKQPQVRARLNAPGPGFLPPYSPDFNPIELAFAKLKALLRRRAITKLRPSVRDLPGFLGPAITGEQRRSDRLSGSRVLPCVGATWLRQRAHPVIGIRKLCRFEFRRRQVPETRMRSHLVVVAAPLLDADLASTRLRNHCRLKYSSRNLPLNNSSVAFCHGFPGSMSAVSMPASASQRRIAAATNSGPSVRAQVAWRAVHADELRQDFNHAAGSNAAGDVDGQALTGPFIHDRQALQRMVYSRTDRTRSRTPTRGSARSSVAAADYRSPHDAVDADGAPVSPPSVREPMCAIGTHHVSLTPQEDPNPSIAVPRVLGHQSAHRRHRRGIRVIEQTPPAAGARVRLRFFA